MCKQLYKHRDHLWTFLSDPHVQPANNGAERSLRHAVIRRKLSFGTQSERGDRFVEVMLTVIETCRQQKRSVLQFVRQAIQHRKTESLLLGP
jgi:transposase